MVDIDIDVFIVQFIPFLFFLHLVEEQCRDIYGGRRVQVRKVVDDEVLAYGITKSCGAVPIVFIFIFVNGRQDAQLRVLLKGKASTISKVTAPNRPYPYHHQARQLWKTSLPQVRMGHRLSFSPSFLLLFFLLPRFIPSPLRFLGFGISARQLYEKMHVC
jgi:hypothetical protein